MNSSYPFILQLAFQFYVTFKFPFDFIIYILPDKVSFPALLVRKKSGGLPPDFISRFINLYQ